MANKDDELIERLTKSISEALKSGLSEGIGLAEVARNEAAKLLNEKKKGFIPGPTCFKCRQPVNVCGGPEMKAKVDDQGKPVLDSNGKPIMIQATKDNQPDANHDLIAVQVNDSEAEKYFRGVFINSVKYRSRSNGHKILVPKMNDIAAICSTFEKNERDQRIGKVANHDSGVVSPGSGRSRFVPAHKAWR